MLSMRSLGRLGNGLRQSIWMRRSSTAPLRVDLLEDAVPDVEGPTVGINEPPKITKQRVLDEFGRAYGTGRRKSSVARVWIKEGSGQFVVNDKNFAEYFQPIQREHALGAFIASKTAGLFDTFCTVKGGGISGQAGAVRLGIARALEAYNPQYRILLRQGEENMLTRDSRRVERQKPGQAGARKKFQWVKR